jgi:3',5'-cyclic AMP phosphodiesterase CpdA
MSSGRSVRIAHLSDLHVAHVTANLKRIGRLVFPSAPGEGLFDVLTKLAVSSYFERHALIEPLLRSAHLTHRYDPRTLAAVLGSVARRGVEHVAVTGDLSTLGAASELREASAALSAYGWTGPRCTVVPGNHDRMNFRGVADFQALVCDRELPYLNPVSDELVTIGVDSTAWGADLDWRDMLAMNSRGRIPIPHIEKVDRLLASLPKGVAAILCVHHHVVDLPPDGYVDDWAAQLDPRLSGKAENAELLLDVASARRVALILFGHRHRATRDGFTIRSIPAACSGAVTEPDPQGRLRYRIFDFEGAKLVGSEWVTVEPGDIRQAPAITAPVESDGVKVTVKLDGSNLQEQLGRLKQKRKELDRQVLERFSRKK